ncbi:C-C motif chemokine 13-like [Siphateles boraxobius]|uniref:C-C motif chemokine 13-like n=1 Tax=Siphateles boraxobius TaxID=180520 RepID=UPI0040643814
MRSLMFLLALVLFCSVLMTSSALSAIELARSKCCMDFSNVKIPVRLVKSYSWTSSICPIRAIVFQTFKGREFCVDPETTWVNGHVDKVDKRTTSAASANRTTTTTAATTTTTTTAATTSAASTATTAKTQSPTV